MKLHAVGVCREPPAFRLLLGPDLPVPVQFAVHHTPDVTVLVDERQVAVRQADDAQPDMPEHQPVITRAPPVSMVWSPVLD